MSASKKQVQHYNEMVAEALKAKSEDYLARMAYREEKRRENELLMAEITLCQPRSNQKGELVDEFGRRTYF